MLRHSRRIVGSMKCRWGERYGGEEWRGSGVRRSRTEQKRNRARWARVWPDWRSGELSREEVGLLNNRRPHHGIGRSVVAHHQLQIKTFLADAKIEVKE